MSEQKNPEMAQEYFEKAYRYQMEGKLKHAIRCYRRSIEIHPTAEAHTFLGWTYSHQGLIKDAIRECKLAIEVDPSFGNPYNDIGAYLIEAGEFDEAVSWLKKATIAERYEPRHFPHFNLGRIYEFQGRWNDAIEQYRKALELFPSYAQAQESIDRLIAQLN